MKDKKKEEKKEEKIVFNKNTPPTDVYKKPLKDLKKDDFVDVDEFLSRLMDENS